MKGMLLTTEQVAAKLGKHPETVRIWCRSNYCGFPARKIGRTWRVSESDLDRWLRDTTPTKHDVVTENDVYVITVWPTSGGFSYEVKTAPANEVFAEGEAAASLRDAEEAGMIAILDREREART